MKFWLLAGLALALGACAETGKLVERRGGAVVPPALYGPFKPVVPPSPAARKKLARQKQREADRYQWKPVPNKAFTLGESLLFAVQYGGITAGYATLKIPEIVVKEGRPCYHILAEARTHPFFETFFKVRDRIDSYIDTDYGFSWGYEKHIREGGFSADAVYVYDQRTNRIKEPGKPLDAPMPKAAQDVLSCFYLYRNLPMVPGQPQTIPVTADDGKSYELKVEALRKEKVQTLAGEFDCMVVRPLLTFKGVFQQKGEVLMWISDDARRLPVLIRSKIVIGAININLKDAEWVEPEIKQ